MTEIALRLPQPATGPLLLQLLASRRRGADRRRSRVRMPILGLRWGQSSEPQPHLPAPSN